MRPLFLILIIILIPLASLAKAETTLTHKNNLLEMAPAVAGAKKFTGAVGQPLLVTFFASWCPPCTDEFKNLNAAIEQLRTGGESTKVRFVGVNLFENFGGKENPGRMARFIARTQPQFPLVKGDEEISEAFGSIDRIPTVVLFDRTGNEVWRFVHAPNAKKTHVTTSEILAQLSRLK